MTDAPERIWIEDELGEGDDDQWTYGTWDVRNYRGYDVEYVRADIVQALTAERERLALAICGGEDAPGYANAQTVETLEHVANQNWQSHGETINSLLAAERNWRKYEGAWMTAEGKLADAEALIEAQAKDHASNNIRFAEAEHRAKTAEAERDEAWAYMSAAQGDLYDAIMIEAERDRLREALKELLEVSRRAVRLSVEHDNFKLYAMEPMERAILLSRAALKGDTHD